MSRGTAMSTSSSGRPPRARMTSSSSSSPRIGCGEAVDATTTSARSSCAGSSSSATTPPLKRSASARARSAWRLATKIVRTPRAASARAVSSLVSPAPMMTTCGSGFSPSTVHRELDRDRRDRRAAEADRRLRAHALAGLQRGGEEAVRQRPGRAGGERLLVGALDLALDLGLADDHRLQAAADAEQLPRGVAVARRVDLLGELGRAHVRELGEHAEHAALGEHGVADDERQLGAVARRDDDGLVRPRDARRPPAGSRASRAGSARGARAAARARSCARCRA